MVAVEGAARCSDKGLLHILLDTLDRQETEEDRQIVMECFETPVVRCLIQYKWQTFGQNAFYRKTAFYIILMVAWNTLALQLNKRRGKAQLFSPNASSRVQLLIAVVCCFCSLNILPIIAKKIGLLHSQRYDILQTVMWCVLVSIPLACGIILLCNESVDNDEAMTVDILLLCSAIALIIAVAGQMCVEEAVEFWWHIKTLQAQKSMRGMGAASISLAAARKYAKSIWNFLDLSILVLVVVTVSNLLLALDFDSTVQISVVGTLMLWARGINYLAGWETTAVYVRMTTEIISDMSTFLLMLAIFVFGNCFALMALYPERDDMPNDDVEAVQSFQTFGAALFTSFNSENSIFRIVKPVVRVVCMLGS